MRLTLTELLTATGGQWRGDAATGLAFRRIELDSRRVQPGDLFWAVRGERYDGHDYIDEAIRRGAAACVSEARSRIRENSDRLIEDRILTNSATKNASAAELIVHVENTITALADLARWHRGRNGARVLGVTGSVGKTTTRNMIHAALSSRLAGMQSPRNYNNHFGVPLSLLEIESDHSFAVLELGASRVGEIQELAAIAQPEIGIVTAVAPAHVEGFGSIENIESAKGELVESLPTSGLAVLNGDDPRVRRMAGRTTARVTLIGETKGNHIQATDVRTGVESLAFRVDGHEYNVPATGRHFLTSALAAIAVGREFGLSPDDIRQGLLNFRPTDGRCVVRRSGRITILDDTYNASPRSMEAALRLLADWPAATRRVAILGDMKELGREAAEHHRELGRLAAELRIDRLIAVGSHADDVMSGARRGGMPATQCRSCESLETAFERMDRDIAPSDVVLVKGSRSMRMERMTAWLEARGGVEECGRGEVKSIGRTRLISPCPSLPLSPSPPLPPTHARN